MLDIFKKEIKVSDRVKLYLTIGREIEGEVVEIGETHVLVKSADGIQTRFFDKLIGGWDLIASIKQEEETIKQDDEIIKQEGETTPKLDEQIRQELLPLSQEDKQIGLKVLGKIDLEKIKPKRIRDTYSTDLRIIHQATYIYKILITCCV